MSCYIVGAKLISNAEVTSLLTDCDSYHLLIQVTNFVVGNCGISRNADH